MRELLAHFPSTDSVTYSYNFVDLDDDGIPEVMVHLLGRSLCGSGGCETAVLRKSGDHYVIVSEISLTRTPIFVSLRTTHHWRDLIVYVAGGGMMPGYFSVLPFDGKTYPENPTVHPAQPLHENARAAAYLSGPTKLELSSH